MLECGAMEDMDQNAMQWKLCPAKMYPKKAFFGWFLIVLVGALLFSTSIILGICLTALLIASQANFLFSSTFIINDKGFIAKYPLKRKQIAWEQVQRVQFCKDICYFFTRKKPSTLDCWSGAHILYGDKRIEVVDFIKARLHQDIAT
jgi:hypothetical protein